MFRRAGVEPATYGISVHMLLQSTALPTELSAAGIQSLIIEKFSPDARDNFIDVSMVAHSDELVELMDSYDNLRTSKAQMENSHVDNKFYPKHLKYQMSDNKQPKVGYRRGHTINCL
ncbi:hypothetical protein CEXT_406511 [Caerostris extrusa]|uniref:Uncharacterized protein n=1 Tax=Caerostris extrusa TaxID=172846 RepID=A0AAV4MWH1_CAEEX|nr:hypothetical protein CEXT_406511 [Caerostris extrusa]